MLITNITYITFNVDIFQGKAISIAEAAFGVGTMFGPSIGGLFYELGGFSIPFWVTGNFKLLWAVFLRLSLQKSTTFEKKCLFNNSPRWCSINDEYPAVLLPARQERPVHQARRDTERHLEAGKRGSDRLVDWLIVLYIDLTAK